jgi:hypothetical protein
MNSIKSIHNKDYVLEKLELCKDKHYYKDPFNNIIDNNLNIVGIVGYDKYYFFDAK